ncbi:hypothetical protein AAVH_15237, partial [Aphelenchoides avenae]
MERTNEEIPPKRKRSEAREKTRISQDTMLEVLLWLDRFDLDAKQITVRRLRSLVENKQMPLRKVDRVDYNGAWRRSLDPAGKRNTLSIHLEEDEGNGPADVEILI